MSQAVAAATSEAMSSGRHCSSLTATTFRQVWRALALPTDDFLMGGLLLPTRANARAVPSGAATRTAWPATGVRVLSHRMLVNTHLDAADSVSATQRMLLTD